MALKRTKKNETFNVLCLDPSIRNFGYSILANYNYQNRPKLLDCGCISTDNQTKKLRIRAGDDFTRRLNEIGSKLAEVIYEHDVLYIVAELPHGSQSASAAKTLGGVTGLVQAIEAYLEIPIEWYSEADSKKALLGKKSATKQEIIDKINQKYHVPWPKAQYKQEAIADSLAVHNVAMRNSQTLKFMKQ